MLNHKGHFFHWTLEGLSRLAYYVDFLRNNPQIRILIVRKHVLQKVTWLEALGIEGSRVITGYVTARVVYLPQGSLCTASVPPLGMMLLSQYLLTFIHTYIRPARAPRDAILLIHRTSKRWLAQHDIIKDYLAITAEKHNMELLIFSDLRLPSLSVTMEIFHRAALVVAPHGAGLVNLLFSRAPTVVVEVVQSDSTFSYVNMCRSLGHVYHGITSRSDVTEGKEPMYVNLDRLQTTVQFYLDEFILPNEKQVLRN